MNHIYGTISHGTMRPEDLIPSFLYALEYITGKEYSGIRRELDTTDFDEPDHFADIDWMLETLFEELDNVAPEGHYFGAHVGDGADFGFWPAEEF